MNSECFHEWEEIFRYVWNDSEKDDSGKPVEVVRIEAEYRCNHCGLVIRKKYKKTLTDYLNEINNPL